MIELRTPYGSFDLGADFKISIVDDNNALSWNSTIKVERSYPFSLPWTPNNAQIWMHADIAESHSERLRIQCDLIVEGNLEFRGLCNLLQSIEGKSYNVNVTFNNEVIIPEQLLTDVPNDDVLSTYSAEQGYEVWTDDVSQLISGNASTHKYACPVLRQDHNTYQYLNHWDLSTQEYRDGNIVPMFYLKYVLEKIAASWGCRLEGSFSTDPELLKVVIFNVYNYNAGQYIPGPIYFMSTPKLELKNHLPKITVGELMAAIRIRWGCGTWIDTAKGTLRIYTLRDMFTRKRKEDITQFIKGRGYSEITPDNGGNSYEQTQDSTDTLTEFIREQEPVNYKGTTPNLFTLFSIVAPKIEDVYLVLESDYYWKYNGVSWTQYQYRYHQYILGPNKVTDPSGAVMCDMMWDGLNSDDWKTLRCAYPKQEVENNIVEPSLRFAIYQGMHNAQNIPQPYPMGSIDHIDSGGAQIGNMDLRDDGTYGLYNQYKIYRAQMESNRKKPTLYLKECNSIMHKLTPDTAVQVNNQEYLWARKTRTYDIRGLVDVELECVKI